MSCARNATSRSTSATPFAKQTLRETHTCADAWVDVSLQVGIVVNYGSYGPAVLGIVSETGYTYLLGPAILSDTGAIWSYGYRDGGGSAAPDSYGTWYYRVDAVFE